ncbi:hypothetical protein [Actinoplanes sp. URMC 104]|uniref:hypothetical protein n=1 Tax=Actinoplanes sp. URMC 104 TaxID=3423409 RepID=UPI003F1DD9D9
MADDVDEQLAAAGFPIAAVDPAEMAEDLEAFMRGSARLAEQEASAEFPDGEVLE